jgi:hypothetical protein
VSAGVPDVRARLEKAALQEIFDGGAGGLCDSVEEPHLDNITIGTISREGVTGDLTKPLPAIMAQHDFVCVDRATGTRTQENDQWVIVAIDDDAQLIRCLRTGLKATVQQVAQECDFAAQRLAQK